MRAAVLLPIWDDPTLPGIVRDLRLGLAARGSDLFAVTLRTVHDEPAFSDEEGFRVYRVGRVFRRGLLKHLEPVWNLFAIPWATLAILRREPHDLVHYHFSGADWNHAAAIAPFLSKPLFVTFHGHLSEYRRSVLAWICGRVIASADAVSAVSDAAADAVRLHFPRSASKMTRIYNGVDLAAFAPEGPRPAPGARPYILSIARLAAYKGVDLLVLALLDLVREGRDVDLIVCGPENDDGHVRGLIEALGLGGRVRLTGVVDKAEIARLLRGCEFMALPSRHGEGFSLAILEALAAGKAVAATAKGGSLECLRDEENALLFAPLDLDGLKNSLRRLLDDGALRARLEKEALRTASSFSREEMCARYLDWYDRHLCPGPVAR